MKIRAFITHKLSETNKDCQDRFGINIENKSIAVSDGMSQSIFQKVWAEILVNSYVEKNDFVPTNESINELSQEWYEQVEELIKKKKEKGLSTWRAEDNISNGYSACATFLGIRFTNNKWEGDVLGDSCLIKVNTDNTIESILSSQTGVFDSFPDYFDSNKDKKGKGIIKQISGELHKGEKLLLVSDPFSDFFYKKQKIEGEAGYIEELLNLKDHDDFCDLVDRWRATENLHNDDTTLVIVEFDHEDFKVEIQDDIKKLIEEELNEVEPKKIALENESKANEEIKDPQKCKGADNNQAIDSSEKTITKSDFESLKPKIINEIKTTLHHKRDLNKRKGTNKIWDKMWEKIKVLVFKE